MSKKVVIIGGGVSGLACGIYCKKAGFDTLILEKTNSLGGNLTGWFRNGCYIDNCIHWLNGSKTGNIYNKLWREVGAITDETEFNQSKYFFVSELDGKKVGLSQDLDETERQLIAACPEDKRQIKKLISALKLWCKMYESKNAMTKIGCFIKLLMCYGRKTIGQVARSFKTQLMQNFLTDYLVKNYSIYVFLAACSSFIVGDGKVPKAGSLEMAKRIAKKYVSLGGKFLTGKDICKVKEKDGKVECVIDSESAAYKGDYFVFACDTKVTFSRFLKGMPKDLKLTYKKRKTYPIISSFHIAYDIALPHFDLPEAYIFECKPIKIGESYYSRIMLRNYEYGTNFAPEGHIVFQVFLLQTEKDYNYFCNLNEKEYSREKQKICRQVTSEIIKHFPSLKSKITAIDCWTPLTYNKYFGAYKGAYLSFGITNMIRLKKIDCKLKNYKNAYISSQWQTMFGGLPNALIQGKTCAEKIAGVNKTVKA